jgi:hypothetical protein
LAIEPVIVIEVKVYWLFQFLSMWMTSLKPLWIAKSRRSGIISARDTAGDMAHTFQCMPVRFQEIVMPGKHCHARQTWRSDFWHA